MSGERSTVPSVLSAVESLVRFAAAAMLVWVIVEIALRRGGVRVIAGAVRSARGADVILVGVGFPLLAYGLARWGMRLGIEPSDWEYDVSLRSVGIGLTSVVVYFLAIEAIGAVYTQIVSTPQSASTSAALSAGVTETLWVALAFFLVNGVVGPVAEELAWRGVIQTALMESYGVYAGGAITALVFVLKHLIVDMAAPFLRVASLVILAFVFCGLRARYGTASSTVAHVAVNTVSSAAVIFTAL
jgi:membrane protease YdiL (CAAX protease family)